ncbi:MAG: hypothetical protein ACJA0H_000413 [Francisellaceae bacterium]|jgi:hypothetical protein
MARPRKVFTEKELKEIESLGGLGTTQENIAIHMGFSRPLFKRKEVKDAYFAGKIKTDINVRKSMYTMACRDNGKFQFPAAKWWESSIKGVNETSKIDHQSSDGSMSKYNSDDILKAIQAKHQK